ncbi:MAG TPA: ribonuclease HII [Clostridia bacterium]|nr:MAG: Ribonuclease HII [Firmicutes bacterium ADurb.Bin248]HOF99980.1 ribonuclease HII [Clostridia bacterium]HOS19410.1 ribonuclease HII [Clostridia bacterium]
MIRPKEQERLYALTQTERAFWARGVLPAGMDEVGRGPLAGPVVAAAVVLPPEPLIEFINDSKKLSAVKREKLAALIREEALAYGVGWVFQDEIDEINILNATKKAFCEAYAAMGRPCFDALVDAVRGLDIPAAQHPIVHGDALCYLIGAASILAKVERDAFMARMDEVYPEYGFARNKGYGTAEHIAALRAFGPCPLHRRSFIKGILEGV